MYIQNKMLKDENFLMSWRILYSFYLAKIQRSLNLKYFKIYL